MSQEVKMIDTQPLNHLKTLEDTSPTLDLFILKQKITWPSWKRWQLYNRFVSMFLVRCFSFILLVLGNCKMRVFRQNLPIEIIVVFGSRSPVLKFFFFFNLVEEMAVVSTMDWRESLSRCRLPRSNNSTRKTTTLIPKLTLEITYRGEARDDTASFSLNASWGSPEEIRYILPGEDKWLMLFSLRSA